MDGDITQYRGNIYKLSRVERMDTSKNRSSHAPLSRTSDGQGTRIGRAGGTSPEGQEVVRRSSPPKREKGTAEAVPFSRDSCIVALWPIQGMTSTSFAREPTSWSLRAR